MSSKIDGQPSTQISEKPAKSESNTNFLLVTSATALALISLSITKIGPGRAISIYLGSKLFGRPYVASQRTRDVERLRRSILINTKHLRSFYTVVQGAKGIGKTAAIKTALKHEPGVIYVSGIFPDMSYDQIVERVMGEVTNVGLNRELKRAVTQRILFCYKIMCWFGRRQPIVVIQVADMGRNFDKPTGQIAQAARGLSEFGFKVVIDCLYGSILDGEFMGKHIHMEPMSDDLLRKLFPAELEEFLKKSGTYDLVFELCRGCPVRLNSLEISWRQCKDHDSRLKAVNSFVLRQLSNAIWDCSIISSKLQIKKIIDGCVGVPNLKFEIKPVAGLLSDVDFHDLFRVVLIKVNKCWMNAIVPSSPAMAMVLRAGLTSVSVKQAQDLLASWNKMDEMFDWLRKIDYYNTLVEICRCKQDAWQRLDERWRKAQGDEAKKTAVRLFVRDELIVAIEEINKLVNKFPDIKNSVERFKGDINGSLYHELDDYPCNFESVFKRRVVYDRRVYVPCSPTMAVALAAGLRDRAQLEFDDHGPKPENSFSFEDVKKILESWTERDLKVIN